MVLNKSETGFPTPSGYLFSTSRAGIKYKDRDDMALIYSEKKATIAGTFTRNMVKAAPVIVDMKKVKSGTGRAIVINSGNANACTGFQGLRDAKTICKDVAKGLNISEKEVFIASTGVIGTPLSMERIRKGIHGLIKGLGNNDVLNVASAIMTTDTFPKISSRKTKFGKTMATITGIAKGAGMIAPDMATMLCFLLTDLSLEKSTMEALLREAVEKTFNLITVDGDMSTNDTVLFMANGAATNRPIQEHMWGYKKLRDALFEVTDELAQMTARDGEGATKLLIIKVDGAQNQNYAKKAALAVAKSPLVKTAIYGRDANWGRIMAALGRSEVPIKEDLIDISINGIELVKSGLGTGKDREVSASMKKDETTISIHLKSGRFSERVYTCDLTEEYIKINAAYRT